jgi:hypothetical protein
MYSGYASGRNTQEAENCVLICASDERIREKCGIDWRKSA